MPKRLQETTSIIQPSYVTTTPFGSYIDISKPGGFAASAREYQQKDPSRWTTKDLASQSYFEQGLSPVAVSEKVHATMPKRLQETTSIIQPSYVTTTPFGSYIDISKPGGFAALAQQSGVKQESYFEERVVGTKKCQMDLK